MDAINLNRLVYFAAVVDAGSFTRAAERLGITKTVVSQQVSKLEAELKTALLMRTTRRVEPTEAGKLLHARSLTILREAGDAIAEVTHSNAEPSGMLRIAAPNDYGTSMIAPIAARFSSRYPDCQVDLILSDTRMDPVANQVDLSVRVGWLDDSSLQARRVGSFQQVLVATPQLARTLALTRPEELPRTPFIANGALKEPLDWHFVRPEAKPLTVRLRPMLAINSTPAVLTATLTGAGLSILPGYLVADHIGAGRLVRILPEWTLPEGGIHVVYPAARFRPPKVTAFVTMLVQAAKQAG